MNEAILHLYHALPPSMRNSVATLRGIWLRWWRYGSDAEQLVAEALERERWPVERMRAWQEERLAYVLHRAATQVPYYRAHWTERRRRGDRAAWDRLEHWPALDKDALRATPHAFVADDRSVRRMFEVHTSGTSGKPLTLWRSRSANKAYYALLETRFLRWHGASWRNPWAVLGGQVVVSPRARRPPYWVWNRAMHQLYLSANHVSAQNAEAYVEGMNRYGVRHLEAYASSATELARQCLAAGVHYPNLDVVVTNAEPLDADQRDVIQRGLGAPARETYGMVEIVAGASECEAGTRHLWPELGTVEVFEDGVDSPTPAGAVGRLVCTGLVNADMPLIRYIVGDRGSLPPGPTSCGCGRTLPVMGPIEGRSSDMLIAPDGRHVFWLNPVFYGLPIQEAQIIQDDMTQTTVRYVPTQAFTDDTGRTVTERLRDRMGDVRVVLEPMPRIPRGPNGKFKPVICRVRRPVAPSPNGSRSI